MNAFKECPSFDSCSVNDCPMADGAYTSFPNDPEIKCIARISSRQDIAAKHNLSNGGLTTREQKRERRRAIWAALAEEEKQRRLAGLKPFKTGA